MASDDSDVLIWNCRYFDALSKGETPPVKDRLEFQLGQPMERPLTQGLLAVLHKQAKKTTTHLIYSLCILLFLYVIKSSTCWLLVVQHEMKIELHVILCYCAHLCSTLLLTKLNFLFQLGGKPIIELSSLEEKWKHLSLPKDTLDELLR